MWFEIGTYYPQWNTVETGPDSLNVPVGVVAGGVCLACYATGLVDYRHGVDDCIYVRHARTRPGKGGRPRDLLRDPQVREDRDPVQNQPPTGEGEQEPVPGVG